ncbi:MAG: hypothetical protein QOI21_4103 [Actinomycetota bacterium]|nr:hypothetical protein [Actinomycetota bacterium]
MTSFLADVPVEIGRDDARRAASAELADPGYRAAEPSLVERVFTWIGERISALLSGVSNSVPGGIFGLVVLVVVVIVLVVVIRLKAGKLGRAARQQHRVFEGRVRSADEYRRSAEAAAARGDFDEAVRERFRAVVRALEQRALLDERSGRTADEAAADAGGLLPGCADELRHGAAAFDDVHYGGRSASAEVYQRLVDLDALAMTERPIALGAPR